MKIDDSERKVIEALRNPRFKWRTIGGIAKEAKLSPEAVRNIVVHKSDRVVMSSVPNTKGETLFALREKHRAQASTFHRIVSVLKNRGD